MRAQIIREEKNTYDLSGEPLNSVGGGFPTAGNFRVRLFRFSRHVVIFISAAVLSLHMKGPDAVEVIRFVYIF